MATNVINRAIEFGTGIHFVAAADTSNFSRGTIASLTDVGVMIEDIGTTRKRNDRADSVLLSRMYDFMSVHDVPATMVIISADKDFARMLAESKKKGHRTVLVHPTNGAGPSNATCADYTYDWAVWCTANASAERPERPQSPDLTLHQQHIDEGTWTTVRSKRDTAAQNPSGHFHCQKGYSCRAQMLCKYDHTRDERDFFQSQQGLHLFPE